VRAALELDRPTGARRWRGALAVALLVAMTGAAGWTVLQDRNGGSAQPYLTTPARHGPLVVSVIATGSIQPTNQVDVSSELSGTIRRILVDYNSVVAEGQVLAELDTDKLRATVEHSRAAMAAARAGVVEARATVIEKTADLRRKQQLAADKVASRQDLDAARAAAARAEAALASAEAQVEVARSQLTIDETNLTKASIRSPISGVVLQRNASIGQTVASSFQAPILFSIAEDLRQMELQVDIDEADVGKVAEGQGASFSVDAYPDRKFPATIRQLRFASQTSAGVVTYKAVLAIDNALLLLRPGMTATADITVQRVDDALLIPNAALRFTPPQPDEPSAQNTSFLTSLLPHPPAFRQPSRPEDAHGQRKVWVLRDGVATPVMLVAGASDGQNTQVSGGGLADGDAVITDLRATRK
jgi:HlyD family secretion protein